MSKRIGTARWYEKYGRWQIKVQKDGVRKTFTSSVRGRKGQRIANEKADRWLDSVATDSNITVERLLRLYFGSRKRQGIKEQTLIIQKSRIKKSFQAINHMRVEDVSLYQLQSIFDGIAERSPSVNYLRVIKGDFTSFFKFAQRYGLKTVNANLLEIPKKAMQPERRFFTIEDCRVILTDDSTFRYKKRQRDEYITVYRFMLLTGLRIGETLSLRWSDISDGVISVQRNLNKFGEIDSTKTSQGVRKIPVTDMIQSLLDDTRHISKYIFNTDDLSISTSLIHGNFKRYCDYHQLSASNLHALRHAFVSLSDAVLPLNTVKSIVGHTEKMDTVGVYGHAFTDEFDKARDVLQKVFEKLKE